ncbi:hypothetical protein [Xenorhabdus koppenhoeferi]|uniref:hypothetical protein n=1 Tax=Xenorhabdus koppenhoeferi TaxID=351659 RepID=UPI0015A6D77D|nr:hypothetical protein [Xenorhabdus koppenhoeferi]
MLNSHLMIFSRPLRVRRDMLPDYTQVGLPSHFYPDDGKWTDNLQRAGVSDV